MNDRSPEMLKPTLVAGTLFGVLAAVPYLDVVNGCTCCSMVVAAGFFASYLYSRRCREAGVEFRPAGGAVVGLIAGAFFAVAVTAVGTFFHATLGNPGLRWMLDLLLRLVEQVPDVPADSLDKIEQARAELDEWGFSVLGLVLDFLKSVVLGAIFSTIGGLVGGAVFKVERTAAPPTSPVTGMPGSVV
jgi:hypothetical protein